MPSSIAQFWDDAIVPTITDYIRIPAKSPHFDQDWAEARPHRRRASQLAVSWCRRAALAGMKLEVVRLEGRTPVLFMDVAGRIARKTVLIYGHLDKQPEMVGWREGYGPWTAAHASTASSTAAAGPTTATRCSALVRCAAALQDEGRAARALRDPHRVLRGERQRRPAGLPRRTRSADRHARLRHLPRFRLRQLRAALEHDLAARPGERRADGRGAERGRALRRRERRRAFELPHRAHAARAHRRRRHRRREARQPSTRRSRRSARRRRSRAAAVLGEEIWRKFPFMPAACEPMHGRAAPSWC